MQYFLIEYKVFDCLCLKLQDSLLMSNCHLEARLSSQHPWKGLQCCKLQSSLNNLNSRYLVGIKLALSSILSCKTLLMSNCHLYAKLSSSQRPWKVCVATFVVNNFKTGSIPFIYTVDYAVIQNTPLSTLKCSCDDNIHSTSLWYSTAFWVITDDDHIVVM